MAANSRFSVATHILVALAASQDDQAQDSQSLTSEYIASSVNTSPVLVRRLLGQLHRAGLIDGAKGCKGGARLARSPAKISLLDVYLAMGEGPLVGQNPNPPNPKCPVSKKIRGVLDPLIDKAQRAFLTNLKSTKISDLVREISKI